MIETYIGSGGKTTMIFQRAQEAASAGKTVIICTTTKMFAEENVFYIPDMPDIQEYSSWKEDLVQKLEAGRIVQAGILSMQGKITGTLDLIREFDQLADLVLVEADGSKHMPLKYPDWNREPVIPENTGKIFLLCSLAGINRPVKESVFRPELAYRYLKWSPEHVVQLEDIPKLLQSGYLERLQEIYPGISIVIAITNASLSDIIYLENKLNPYPVVFRSSI